MLFMLTCDILKLFRKGEPDESGNECILYTLLFSLAKLTAAGSAVPAGGCAISAAVQMSLAPAIQPPASPICGLVFMLKNHLSKPLSS